MGHGTAGLLGDQAGRCMLSALGRGSAAGVSLVESMMVLAVAAVVLSMAAPALGRWVRDLEVRSSATALLAALQAGRAEAVARHAEVRLTLGDAQGRATWVLSCVRVSARCPAIIRRQPPDNHPGARWSAVASASETGFGAALAAGTGMPASVRFNAMGAALVTAGDTSAMRIDVTHADSAEARRLIVLISEQGMVRMCDPLATATHPEHCH